MVSLVADLRAQERQAAEELGLLNGLPEALSAGTIALEISSRNSPVAAIQKRWERLRARLDLVLDQRGADIIDIPGGAGGLQVRDYKGQEPIGL